jgi:hypothetical protein
MTPPRNAKVPRREEPSDFHTAKQRLRQHRYLASPSTDTPSRRSISGECLEPAVFSADRHQGKACWATPPTMFSSGVRHTDTEAGRVRLSEAKGQTQTRNGGRASAHSSPDTRPCQVTEGKRHLRGSWCAVKRMPMPSRMTTRRLRSAVRYFVSCPFMGSWFPPVSRFSAITIHLRISFVAPPSPYS